MTSILVADDHPYILQALEGLLGRQRGFEVIASVGDGPSALSMIRRLRPDIAVLDVNMPGLSGLDILRAIAKDKSRTRVVFLTAAITDGDVLEAVAAGIAGLVLKQSAPDTLIDCLRRIGSGGEWLPPELVKAALTRETKRREEERLLEQVLTAREVEVVRLAAIGLSNRSIAGKLGVTEGTVKLHLHNIYTKLGVSNRTELTAMALTPPGSKPLRTREPQPY
jgi:DNA-binding NarL/FixJ family response regulator